MKNNKYPITREDIMHAFDMTAEEADTLLERYHGLCYTGRDAWLYHVLPFNR